MRFPALKMFGLALALVALMGCPCPAGCGGGSCSAAALAVPMPGMPAYLPAYPLAVPVAAATVYGPPPAPVAPDGLTIRSRTVVTTRARGHIRLFGPACGLFGCR